MSCSARFGRWALLASVLLAACREPAPRPDLALLPLLEPFASSNAPASDPAAAWSSREAARVAIEHSERLAAVTRPGVEWRVEVELAPGDVVAWSAAVPVPGAAADPLRPAAADAEPPVLEPAVGTLSLLLADGREVVLDRRQVAPGAWREQRVAVTEEAADALPRDGRATLRLASDGPLAWAEPSLLRRDAAEPTRPNLVLVSIDTLRADRLGLYGGEHDTSPHLGRFAGDAWVFERALSSSTWTLPSHGSLFTGLLPDQHGLIGTHDRLGPATPTVAERLHRLGYRTVAFTDGGFLAPRWGLSAGFDRYDTTPGLPWQAKDVAVVVDSARRWLEANGHEPFFLFVHTYEVHQPYRNPEGFADSFLPLGADRTTPVEAFALAAFPADPEQAARARAFYDGGVARADHYLGGWLEALRAAGALDDTAVIVTSDHGEELGDHGAYEHALGRLYEENVRVPLIVRPAGGTPGRRVAVPVTSLDVAPTLLGWAGAADPTLAGEPLGALAETGLASRPVLVHGSASLPDRVERRYRMDQGTETVIFDRKRSLVLHFDRDGDPEMRLPERLWWEELRLPDAEPPPAPEGVVAELLSRLQMVQAWLEGEGLATPLPPEASAVQVREGSALVPLGVWDAATWRPLHVGHRRGRTTPGWPALLRFELRAGGQPRQVWLEGVPVAEGEGRPPWAPLILPLTARRELAAPGWNPITGALPRPGEVFRPAPKPQVLDVELDERAREELRALGYLR